MQSHVGRQRPPTSPTCWLAIALIAGCSGAGSSNTSTHSNSNGGAPLATGGSSSEGGTTATGGDPTVTAGQSGTGGASNPSSSATGGAVSTGGAAETGGTRATGGTATGGTTTGVATGGAAPTGGSKSTGGTTATATTAATGGKLATGGSKGTGGSIVAGGTSSTGGASTGGIGGSTGGPASSTELCTRWNADRADVSEAGWTGAVNTCTAGDMSATGRANALKLLNLHRWIAGLPAVTTSDQHNQDNQACALMMAANKTLNHTPPTTWTCYTANGATAAGSSNISGSSAVSAIGAYMVDPGNETTLGHRRWCLSNSLGPTGIGSTGTYSCMWTLNGTGAAGKPWMAWPPPGYFPIQAASDNWNRTLDTTGWSLQSDTINLSAAVVSVTLDGTSLPVTVAQLGANYGSRYAISFIASGWKMAAGNTYHVSITGISTAISYDVQVVSC